MKTIHEKLLASVLAASALAVSAFAPVAYADVSASVGVSNMYYWRGLDLGQGDAAVWGDLKASSDAGLYGGVWMSSGDATNGTEYDLYFGYGAEIGGLGVDISYWSYNYPAIEVAPGDLTEIVLGLSYGPVAFTYYDNQEGNEQNYKYMTLEVSAGDFSIKYGTHSEDETLLAPGVSGSLYDGYSHLDLTYNYNDNLSFTLGNVIDNAEVQGIDVYSEDPKFIVNYSFSIE